MIEALLPAGALIAGFTMGWFLRSRTIGSLQTDEDPASRLQAAEATRTLVEQQYNDLKVDSARQLASLQTALEAEQNLHREKAALFEDSKRELTHQVQEIVSEVFEAKTRKFAELNEDRLDIFLRPLRTKIGEFQTEVRENARQTVEERTLLKAKIQELAGLNERLGREARELTLALKGDSKAQGNWGEIILDRLLEISGLEKGVEYETQVHMKSEDDRQFYLDVLIRLPESKSVIIDAKVSLTAYEKLCSAGDQETRNTAQTELVRSIRAHIKELASKDYSSLPGLRTVDVVLMFIPIEGVFSTAMQIESSLLTDAFSRNVIIVTPSSLFATLKTMAHMWRQEKQNQNATEIAERAGALYDKFVLFNESLTEIGSRIDSAKDAWIEARKRLSEGKGNVVRQVEMLRQLGARTSRQLPQSLPEKDD